MFLEVGVVAVHIDGGRGGGGGGVTSAVGGVCEMVFVIDKGGGERFEFGHFC